MKNRKVTDEESRQIRLDILKEVDSFCRNNHLTYFLAYGTLLGAIRHKGYIPWDDDTDIMMPRKDLEIFKKTFKSDKYKFLDIDTECGYEFPFPRISYNETFDKRGLTAKYYGVNIDVYPIDGLPEDDDEIRCFFAKYKSLIKQRQFWLRVRKKIIKNLPIKTIPFIKLLTKRCVDWIKTYDMNNSSKVMVIDSRVYNKRIFDGIVEVPFEGYIFYAPIGYDEFLKTSYGDYMNLPPEDQRHPYHGGHYYWK